MSSQILRASQPKVHLRIKDGRLLKPVVLVSLNIRTLKADMLRICSNKALKALKKAILIMMQRLRKEMRMLKRR